MLLVSTAGSSAGEVRRTTVWQTPLGRIISSPIPFPSAEAPDSVVLTLAEGQVVRLDAHGREMFRYDIGTEVSAMPAVGDVDGDGAAEIVAGGVRGRIVCLAGDGTLKWAADVRAEFQDLACIVLAARPTGGCDVLVNSQDGWLICLDGQGRRRWRFKVEPYRISSPAAADLNGDGVLEFIAGADYHRVVAVSAEGRLLWEFPYEVNFGRSLALVADADRDGRPEVYIAQSSPPEESSLCCLDGPTGEPRWIARTDFHGYGSLAAADLNGDGRDEILAGDKSTTIYAFSHTGRRLWERSLGGHGIFFNPAVADVNGDGRLEIIVGARHSGTDGNSLYLLDTQGNVLGAYPHDGNANTSPAVADFDGDGRLEVIASSNDKVFAYRFGDPSKAGEVVWPCYRGNAALTGSRLPLRAGEAPAESPARGGLLLPKAFDALLGDTPVTATWSIPTPEQGRVEVSVADPRGVRVSHAFRTSPDARSADVVVPCGHGGRYEIEARLLDTAQRAVLLEDVRQITFEPLAAERRLAEVALDDSSSASGAAVSAAPQIAGELERRRSSLSSRLTTVQAQVDAAPADAEFPQGVLDAAAQLRAAIRRDAAFADLARKIAAASPDALLAVWQDPDPWDNTDPRDQLPDAPAAACAFSAWAYGNQREDIALNLMPLGPDPTTVRVEPSALVGPDGAEAPWQEHLELRRVVWLHTRFGCVVADMLPALDGGRTLDLAPGHFAQLWLVVNTKGLAPGAWTARLRLQSLTPSAAAAEVTLNLEVLPVALPYPYPWKKCNWVHPMGYPESVRDQVIESLISHGSNVLYNTAPTRRCDAEGGLIGDVDWAEHDELILKTKAADPVFFYTGIRLEAPDGVPEDSPVWKRAYKAWMQEFVDHLASLGVDYRDFVFYPVDEPGLAGHTSVDALIAAARRFREADPQAPVYANPSGGVTLDTIREMDPWVDVWCPEVGMLERLGDSLLDIIATRDRQVWCYQAPGDVRALEPLGFYRMQPWVALRYGLQGSGYWTYHYAPSNLWGVGPDEPDYGAVFVDAGEVTPSRRWRASHDGVQDVTAVILLDEAIAQAEQAGVYPDLCEKARAVRARAVAEITHGQDEVSMISRFFLDYAVEFDLLQRHRRAVADATLALHRALASPAD